jgi:hypothetical protein
MISVVVRSLIILGNSVVSVLRLDSRSRASERHSSSSPSAVIRLVVVQGETLCWDSPPIVYQTHKFELAERSRTDLE